MHEWRTDVECPVFLVFVSVICFQWSKENIWIESEFGLFFNYLKRFFILILQFDIVMDFSTALGFGGKKKKGRFSPIEEMFKILSWRPCRWAYTWSIDLSTSLDKTSPVCFLPKKSSTCLPQLCNWCDNLCWTLALCWDMFLTWAAITFTTFNWDFLFFFSLNVLYLMISEVWISLAFFQMCFQLHW